MLRGVDQEHLATTAQETVLVTTRLPSAVLMMVNASVCLVTMATSARMNVQQTSLAFIVIVTVHAMLLEQISVIIEQVDTVPVKKFFTPIVLPAKSDSDIMFCLPLFSNTLPCTLHLS